MDADAVRSHSIAAADVREQQTPKIKRWTSPSVSVSVCVCVCVCVCSDSRNLEEAEDGKKEEEKCIWQRVRCTNLPVCTGWHATVDKSCVHISCVAADKMAKLANIELQWSIHPLKRILKLLKVILA